MSHGTFCFMSFDGYGWYLSSTAALLYCSYWLHNVIAWLKIRPFFTGAHASFSPRTCTVVRWTYLTTLTMSAPVLIFQIVNNFRFFNNISTLYSKVRPYEPLMRDPWWVFSCMTLFYVIRKCYAMNTFRLIQKTPRFGILLASIIISLIFTITDIVASITNLTPTDGINPFWKMALVFKCLTDNIMLDDFKSVLQRLGAIRLTQLQKPAMIENSLNLEPDGKAGLGLGSGSDLTDRGYDRDDTGFPVPETPHRWFSHFSQHQPRHDQPDPPADSTADPGLGRQTNTRFLDPSQDVAHSRLSISGRPLEDGEILDHLGRTRRKHSFGDAAHSAHRLGEFIRDFRRAHLAFGKHKDHEKETRENTKKNAQGPQANPGSSADVRRQPTIGPVIPPPEDTANSDAVGPTDRVEEVETPMQRSPPSAAPWEQMDFITTFTGSEEGPSSSHPKPSSSPGPSKEKEC